MNYLQHSTIVLPPGIKLRHYINVNNFNQLFISLPIINKHHFYFYIQLMVDTNSLSIRLTMVCLSWYMDQENYMPSEDFMDLLICMKLGGG